MKHTIFMHETGPLIQYDSTEEVLVIEDLNPQIKLTWRLSRLELMNVIDNLKKALRS